MRTITRLLVQKTQPGVAGGGTRKYYASMTQRNQITLKEFRKAKVQYRPSLDIRTQLRTASYVKVNNGV